MECPNCKKDSGMVLHNDLITCSKCEEVLHIDYCACYMCNYSWRMNGGNFMDGGIIEAEGLQEAVEQLEGLLKESTNSVSMSDMIHKCIRCGEPAIKDKNTFECSICGFKWEILSTLED